MADLQVSIALLLENQEQVAQQLAAAGGKAGADFARGLTGESRKAFDDLVQSASKAAKDVGVRFNSTKLQFETSKGDLIPSGTLEKIGRLSKGFDDARKAVDVFKSAVSTASKESTSNLNLLEAAVTGVAVSLTSRLADSAMAGIGSLKNMVTGFMELDTELRSAAAAAGETGGYERLGAIVDKVGIDAAGTSKQVAELATSLVKAGFSVSEVETALPGVVRGAEATGTAFERFGEIAGSTLRQFGLEASEINRVTDVLAQTVNGTNATVEGFAYAMNEAGPVAKALGISLKDTAAAIGILANAGLQGSVAGTGLKTMFLKLQQAAGGATPEVLGLAQGQERLAKIMKMMGGDILDASGKLLPLDQVFQKIKASMDTLGTGDRAALATALFGEDGGPKFLAIINQGTSAIDGVFAKVRDSAGSVDAAREATNGFQRQLATLTGTLDSLGIGVGKVAAEGLTPLLSAANGVVGVLAGLPAPIKEGAGALAVMGTAAVAAGVGLAGLNAAVGMIGGWTALAGSIGTVVALLSGPIAGTVGTILAIGAAAGVVASQFGGMDSGLKRLVQSAGALGAFLITLRLLKAAQEGWTTATKATAVAQAFLTALTGPQGLANVAIAAAAAGAAYAGLGVIIKETGQETAELGEKSKGLKDEIASLDKQITDGKKLNIDTSDLEKIKTEKLAELQKIENPLELKLSIEKAEAQIKSLQEQKDKLGNDKSSTGSSALTAQIRAAEKYRDVLKAAEEGVGGKGFAKLDEASKKFVQDQQAIKDKIQSLMAKKIELPIEAKVERDNIDKEISGLQNLASKNELKFKAGIDLSSLETQLAVAKARLEKVKQPLTKGAFESNDNFAQREAEQKQKVEGYTRNIADLQSKIAVAMGQTVGANERQATAAEKQVMAEKAKADALKASLDAQKSKLEVQQQELGLGDKLLGIDKTRLSAVRELADAYMGLVNAQEGLTQSEFDVKKARNNREANVASDELQAMRDRGAGAYEIAVKEQEIKDIKERGKQIEQEALRAAIEGAAQRFEMEKKILELKQMAERMEAQAAVRASERAVLEAQSKKLELQGKQADPKTSDTEKTGISKQLEIQDQLISLAKSQVAADKEVLAGKEKIFAIEKDTLAMKQKTEANQFRSKAAEQGAEDRFSKGLSTLDQKAGNVGANKMAWADVEKQANKVLSTINDHNEALKKNESSVQGLADAYKNLTVPSAKKALMGEAQLYEQMINKMQKSLSNRPAESTKQTKTDPIEKTRSDQLAKQKEWQQQMQEAGVIEFKAEGVPQAETDKILKDVFGIKGERTGMNQARSDELAKQKDWQKEMEKYGIIEFKAEGVPKAVTDDIIKEAITGGKSPVVDQWFNSKEGKAAIEEWRKSAQGAADDVQKIGTSAKEAGKGLNDLTSQKDAIMPDGVEAFRTAPKDLTLKPMVDTAQAGKDLEAFKQAETKDPLRLSVATSPEGQNKPSASTTGSQDQAPVIRPQVDLTQAEQAMQAFRGQQEQPFSVDFNADTTGLAPAQDLINQIKSDPNSVNVDFNATGLDQIQNGITNADQAIDAFKLNGQSAGNDLTSSFANAANSIVPFSNEVAQLETNLQSLNSTTVDPLQGASESLTQAALGSQELVNGLNAVAQSAANLGSQDLTLTAQVDTTQAAKDLNEFKAASSKDPIDVPVAAAKSNKKLTVDTGDIKSGLQKGISSMGEGLSNLEGDLNKTSAAADRLKESGRSASDALATGFRSASGIISSMLGMSGGGGLGGGGGIADILFGGSSGTPSELIDNANLEQADSNVGSLNQSLGRMKQLASEAVSNLPNKIDIEVPQSSGLTQMASDVYQLSVGYDSAKQSAEGFKSALPGPTDLENLKPPEIDPANNTLKDFAQNTTDTVDSTKNLSDGWISVTASIYAAVEALAAYNAQQPATPGRFAGGGVEGGTDYIVNELGIESFLSPSGQLSMIRAPQYGKWTAPSRGLVIPAGMTARLQAAGAFDHGSGSAPRQVSTALQNPSRGTGKEVAALSRLQASIDRLERAMTSYRPPDIQVNLPNNAGLLHTLQGIR